MVLLAGAAACAQTLFPANKARGVNPDAQLKLTFPQPPAIGKSGEYDSRNADGSPVETSKRSPLSRQLDKNRDAKVIADYRNPSLVLDGWSPRLAKTSLKK